MSLGSAAYVRARDVAFALPAALGLVRSSHVGNGLIRDMQEVLRMRMMPIGEDRVHELERKHRMLDDEVTRLERRAYLTPPEQRQMTDLKKEKLKTKDELMALRRSP